MQNSLSSQHYAYSTNQEILQLLDNLKGWWQL